MEIRKGERLPMNWGGDSMDIESEVIGFGYNTRTCEDIIICRAYDKAVDRYCYAKGTLPQISYDHTKLYWAEGEYAVNDIGDKSIPEGFEPDRRESIYVPGELERQNRKRMLLHHCSVRISRITSRMTLMFSPYLPNLLRKCPLKARSRWC